MKFKNGVTAEFVHWRVIEGMSVAGGLWAEFGKELVITSTTDGVHGKKSYHYSGFAFDSRTRYFDDDQKTRIAQELQRRLSDLDSRFDVVLERTHIHAELDIRKAPSRRDHWDHNPGPVGLPRPTHPPFRSSERENPGKEGGS